MKKLFITLALASATLPALAQHHGHWRHGGGDRWYWMAPLIVGGAVVYEATRPHVVVQQPVIVEQQPVTQNQNCTPWKEVQTSDGKIYRERTCTIN